MKRRLIFISCAIMPLVLLLGCKVDSLSSKEAEVKQILHSNIKIGEAQDKVEEKLKDIGIDFSYDEYSNQYYATIWNERWGPYKALSVYIAFDKSRKVSEIKVFKSYTMP